VRALGDTAVAGRSMETRRTVAAQALNQATTLTKLGHGAESPSGRPEGLSVTPWS